MSAEYEYEPLPGLPEHLPAGEQLLWQGRPEWKSLALRTFKVGWIALYFAVFAGLRLVLQLREGQTLGTALAVVPFALLCLALLCGVAWANARASLYSITTRRVVMRFGVALPMTFNFPFKKLAAADAKLSGEGPGDIVLQVLGAAGVGFIPLWPHVHGWHVARPRPTLLSIAEPARVATILADAVNAWAKASHTPVAVPAHSEQPVVSVGPARPPQQQQHTPPVTA